MVHDIVQNCSTGEQEACLDCYIKLNAKVFLLRLNEVCTVFPGKIYTPCAFVLILVNFRWEPAL